MPNDTAAAVNQEAKLNRAFWSAARASMILDPTVTMLNTGSFGPLPQPVFDRATELRRRLAAGPTDFFVRQAPPLLWEARERTAAFLGSGPNGSSSPRTSRRRSTSSRPASRWPRRAKS